MGFSFFRRTLIAGAGLSAAMVMAAPAAAQSSSDYHGHHEKWPQASLNAEASRSVPQDTVEITLAAELSDPSQVKVTTQLAQTLEAVMSQAKQDEKVTVRSGNYRVWPHTDKNGHITNWQGRGEIIIKSKDFAAASELATKLSDRMPISNLNFSVSEEAHSNYEKELLGEAAEAFRERAEALTRAFGFGSYTIRNVDLSGAGARYVAAPRMMAMAAEDASVPLEPGTQTITVSVRGTIFLNKEQK